MEEEESLPKAFETTADTAFVTDQGAGPAAAEDEDEAVDIRNAMYDTLLLPLSSCVTCALFLFTSSHGFGTEFLIQKTRHTTQKLHKQRQFQFRTRLQSMPRFSKNGKARLVGSF